jgi:hypothetical protein
VLEDAMTRADEGEPEVLEAVIEPEYEAPEEAAMHVVEPEAAAAEDEAEETKEEEEDVSLESILKDLKRREGRE